MDKQSAIEQFRTVMLTVVGQAFSTAGYQLMEQPIKWAGGLFRFKKALSNGLFGFIEIQLLYLPSTEWSGNVNSRFRVSLVRSDQEHIETPTTHAGSARVTLSELVVERFAVNILPSTNHWWNFATIEELGKALAEAGHLTIGYGMPWLSGDLVEPSA
jgi:hypothetical protein